MGTGSSESLRTRSLSVVSACQKEGLIDDDKGENCSGVSCGGVMMPGLGQVGGRGGWRVAERRLG